MIKLREANTIITFSLSFSILKVIAAINKRIVRINFLRNSFYTLQNITKDKFRSQFPIYFLLLRFTFVVPYHFTWVIVLFAYFSNNLYTILFLSVCTLFNWEILSYLWCAFSQSSILRCVAGTFMDKTST